MAHYKNNLLISFRDRLSSVYHTKQFSISEVLERNRKLDWRTVIANTTHNGKSEADLLARYLNFTPLMVLEVLANSLGVGGVNSPPSNGL